MSNSQNRNFAEYEPIGEKFNQLLGSDNEKCYRVYGYKENARRSLLYHIFCILFLGIPYVIFFWYPKLKVIKYEKCTLHWSTLVLFNDNSMKFAILDVEYEEANIPHIGFVNIRYFVYQNTKYVWTDVEQCFVLLADLIPERSLRDILEDSHGLLEVEEERLLKFYGPNKIEVEIKSYWKLFIEEVFNPYYIFQVFSITLWCFDEYLIYAGCILVLTLFSAITGLMETRKQSKALHDLVESSTSTQVLILRRQLIPDGALSNVDPSELVPGDLIVIPKTGCVMPCDAILLKGNCIVNESILTGESVPVTKTPPHESSETYNPNMHKRHTLFCGTHVIQARYYEDKHVVAMVTRTGFDTTKGALVKSIMYPQAMGREFYRDAMKFVLFLFIIAGSGMCFCMYLYIRRQADLSDIIIRTLDIITIVVPPALPAAMTVATVYSQNRLKKLGIFCISPARINICGRLKLACFDKTGTLTHEGLDLCSVIPVEKATFCSSIADPRLLDIRSPLLQGMATCHSVTQIDGELRGDPLDLNMFNSTHFELEETGTSESARYDVLVPTIVKPKPGENVEVSNIEGGDIEALPYEIGIIRQFPFSSTLQCMSVICKDLSVNHMKVFTKGAPEKIASICVEDSLPPEYFNHLSQFTASGYRVIAVAYKDLSRKVKWKETQRMKREVVECDLIFIGFIVMQNTLKAETKPVIAKLHHAKMRSVMITGDNIETAICVARESGMINLMDKVIIVKAEGQDDNIILKYDTIVSKQADSNVVPIYDTYHFAIDGKTWSKLCEYYPDLIPMLIVRTTVFARFQPDQKTQVVNSFQNLDYIVCMVGDGANDCGALKAAHVGVSLSQTEASVAAPFTSTIDNISCLVHLMLEGRCALVTSFAEIKYMAMYSLIQFFTILMLYKRYSILGDKQFLFIDLIITTSFALSLGRQGPANELGSKRPLGSLISLVNLVPLLLQIIFCAAIQFAALYYLVTQPWFEANIPNKHEIILCWENTVLFLISCFQYITLALLYSKGQPFRQGVITNFWLLFSAMVLTCSVTFLMIYPTNWLADFFEILPITQDRDKMLFRQSLLILPIAHTIIAWLIEVLIADSKWLKKSIRCISKRTVSKSKYKLLLHENDVEGVLNYIDSKNCRPELDE